MELSAKNVYGDLIKKVSEISGQNLSSCYQCGKCSSGCPSADRMDNIPSQFIKLIQLGMEQEYTACATHAIGGGPALEIRIHDSRGKIIKSISNFE